MPRTHASTQTESNHRGARKQRQYVATQCIHARYATQMNNWLCHLKHLQLQPEQQPTLTPQPPTSAVCVYWGTWKASTWKVKSVATL